MPLRINHDPPGDQVPHALESTGLPPTRQTANSPNELDVEPAHAVPFTTVLREVQQH